MGKGEKKRREETMRNDGYVTLLINLIIPAPGVVFSKMYSKMILDGVNEIYRV